ncbi:MAG: hypothetical protein ABJC79_03105 [Acidimicrobiia bacterium]
MSLLTPNDVFVATKQRVRLTQRTDKTASGAHFPDTPVARCLYEPTKRDPRASVGEMRSRAVEVAVLRLSDLDGRSVVTPPEGADELLRVDGHAAKLTLYPASSYLMALDAPPYGLGVQVRLRGLDERTARAATMGIARTISSRIRAAV